MLAPVAKNVAQEVGDIINGKYYYLDGRICFGNPVEAKNLFDKITGKSLWNLLQKKLYATARNEVWATLKVFSHDAISNLGERMILAGQNWADIDKFSQNQKVNFQAMSILRSSEAYLNMCFTAAMTRDPDFANMTEAQINDVRAMLILTEKCRPPPPEDAENTNPDKALNENPSKLPERIELRQSRKLIKKVSSIIPLQRTQQAPSETNPP